MPEPYQGAVCPGCGKIAYPFKGGHDSECGWRKKLTPVEDA